MLVFTDNFTEAVRAKLIVALVSELWFVGNLFHYKDRSIIFLDLCLKLSNKDSDFWERILSLNSHVSLFYLLFYLLFYVPSRYTLLL